MSFSPRTLWPGALFIGGILLMVFGYRRLGLVVAGTPVLIGLGVTVWAISRASRERERTGKGDGAG